MIIMMPDFFIKRSGNRIPLTIEEVRAIARNYELYSLASRIEEKTNYKCAGVSAWNTAKYIKNTCREYSMDEEQLLEEVIANLLE